MTQFLTFSLIAPIASFGNIAVGENRYGWDRPARSAILGLIAGCLGIERQEHDKLDALNSIGLAILSENSGQIMTDFHTAQTSPLKDPATRADILSSSNIKTVLSKRDYRLGSWNLGCLWIKNETSFWSLESLKEAMNYPTFSPYLGRKSCPLSLPLAPKIIEKENNIQALMARYYDGPEAKLEINSGYKRRLFKDFHQRRASYRWGEKRDDQQLRIFMDADDLSEDMNKEFTIRIEKRRDIPTSREKWKFSLRKEVVLMIKNNKDAE